MGKSWKEAFPGNYLKSEQIMGKRILVTIQKYLFEEVDDERKLVLRFQGKEKGLVCNKTNATSISDIVGSDDLDQWIGKQIILFQTTTDYQGRRVTCIRVDHPSRGTAPPPPPPPTMELTEDDIPF